MTRIVEFVVENWRIVMYAFLLIALLSLTGNLTITIRNAKQGIQQATTPLGMFIMVVLVLIIYYLYKQFING